MNLDAMIFNVLRSVSASRWGDTILDRALAPYNHFSSQRYTNPYPLYDRVRDLDPVYWHRRARLWIVTGYDETLEILRGPVSVDRSKMITEFTPYRHMEPANASLMLSNMLMQDPPEHTRLRRVVNRGFTPRSVKVMQERIESSAAAVVAELDERRSPGVAVDVVAATRDLPVRMICDLLGVPADGRQDIISIADVLSQFADPVTGFDPQEMDRAVADLSIIVSDLVRQRTSNPGSDLITTLLTPDDEVNALDREEVISMVGLLLVAGQETTSGLIGNAIVAMANSPDQRQVLLDLQGDSRPIEELLRFDSPIQATDRTMVEDLELENGTCLKQGDIAVLCIGGANRDPRQYDRPDRLQLDRDDPRPLSFGHGPHHCLGAALARMQSSAVLTAFVSAFPDYAIDHAGVHWKRSTTLRGPTTVPVRLKG